MAKGLNLLLDTNIWVERLLDQERANEVKKLLQEIPTENLFISDFLLHSIGVILFRLNKREVLNEFLNDLFIEGNVKVLSLDPADPIGLTSIAAKTKLDYDDAYQLQVAIKYELALVTFDKDFTKSKAPVIDPWKQLETMNTNRYEIF